MGSTQQPNLTAPQSNGLEKNKQQQPFGDGYFLISI